MARGKLEQRKAEARELVLATGSYAEAARRLGLSRQRVHQLVGPGLIDTRPRVVPCIDCGATVTTRRRGDARCRRCRDHWLVHGTPWPPSVRRPLGPPRRTHCPRGYELTEANVYVTPDGRRNCRPCSTLRARRNRIQHR